MAGCAGGKGDERRTGAPIPVTLRQALVTAGFHGILERFPGAMLVSAFDAPRFDPLDLDRLLDLCGRVLAAIP